MDIGFKILDWIQDNVRCAFLDGLMPSISFLDNGGWIWMVIAIILICTKKYRNYGVLLLAGLAMGVIVGNLGVKNIVARPRPCWINTDVDLLIKMPGDFSFPSGHSQSSAMAATILTCADRRMGIGAWILAAAIMFSRLYLYVHFPGDVLGGMIIGIGLGIFCNIIMKKLLKDSIYEVD